MAKTTSVRVIGAALRDLREKQGLTLPELARRCGSGRHPQSIRRLETAEPPGKLASRVFAYQIATALCVDLAAFTAPADAAAAGEMPQDRAAGGAVAVNAA